jgi:hypothetical protein
MTARRKTLRIGTGFLPLLMGAGERHYALARDHLPADARVVDCRMDGDGWRFVLVVESAEFPEVPEGAEPPAIEPTFRATP